jgi:predicted permease
MSRITQFFSRSRAYEDLSREIRQHLREKTEALVEAGMTRDDAERAARRAFGNVTALEEEAHDAWGWRWLEDFVVDVRYGVRQLHRNRVLTVAAVVTLALGIGANTAIFTAVQTVLLRPLPFKDPDRLVLVTEYKPDNVSKTGSPLARYRERAAENRVFDEIGGYWNVSGGNGMVFDVGGTAERVQFSIVTSSFLSLLGVQPILGRNFSPSEDAPGGAKVFIASHPLWTRLLGGDPQAIGKSFRLDGEPYTLIGVAPLDFRFPSACDVWTSIGTLGASSLTDRVSHQFWTLGRLRSGVTVAQAQAQLDVIQQRLADHYPGTDANWHVLVRPLLEDVVGNVRTSLWVLMAAVAFVLLIACTNVVNLLLARAVAREKEFAVRTALGAARERLLRQAFSETLLIVLGGTALAFVLAHWALKAIIAIGAGAIPRFEQPHLNSVVLAFSTALALVITWVVGLAPALHTARVPFAESLQAGQRAGTLSRRSRRSRNGLVVFEVALTVLLLIAAGLMLRTFQQLRNVEPGFRPEQLVTMRIALPDALYPSTEQRSAFLETLLERLNATPGIRTVAATDRLPLSGDTNWGGINIVGRPLLDSAHAPAVEARAVSANYFRTVGIPLLRGREFSDADLVQDHPVILINQAMADKFWPGEDPIGKAVVSPYRPTVPPRIIVGIVGNVKDFSLDAESPPEMYGPIRWWNEVNLVLRSPLETTALAAAVRAQVGAFDRNVPVYDATRMEELVVRSIARQRFELFLLAIFASIALVLAAVGIYGVLAFSVSGRTQEIGVRLALGATPSSTIALVLSQGMRSVFVGIAAGMMTSLMLARLIRGLLFQVSPADPLTFVAVALLVTMIGVAACLVPARRAARIDATVALRNE